MILLKWCYTNKQLSMTPSAIVFMTISEIRFIKYKNGPSFRKRERGYCPQSAIMIESHCDLYDSK